MIAMVFALAALAATQQEDFDKVEVTSAKVGEGVYVLNGRGGNIGVSVGEDGVLIIDDQYAPLTVKIRAAVASLTPQPIRFVINTHWHGDHTGGNENLGKAGIVIVAQENVRNRMSVEQFIAAFGEKVPASPKAALPIITFADSVAFHLNGDDIRSFHVAPAHTDGDTVVHFKKANVVHMGDCFFNGMYPFIDLSSGGSIDGIVAAADKVLAMVDTNTKIIPGHGPVGDKAALQAYRDVMASIRDRVKALVTAGKTLDQVKAAQPTKDFDAKWGGGFLKADVFTAIVYQSLKGK
jgi:glyoxylase-like metal-dependent hydrolase (beta-lactamase superfamily II)